MCTFAGSVSHHPYGIPDKKLLSESAFSRKLVLLLGELDNTVVSGSLDQSAVANAQGLHRLARGKAFYQDAKEVAKHMQLPFNWQLHLVPGVGHNKVGMSKAAAEILYYH